MNDHDLCFIAFALTQCPQCGAEPTRACNAPPRPDLGKPGLHPLRVLVTERAVARA